VYQDGAPPGYGVSILNISYPAVIPERTATSTSVIDVLDHVLDKGIVIDAWIGVSLVGIDLVTIEARVVVASIETYLKYSDPLAQVAPVSWPAVGWPSTKRTRRTIS